jgi:hypothetical protein
MAAASLCSVTTGRRPPVRPHRWQSRTPGLGPGEYRTRLTESVVAAQTPRYPGSATAGPGDCGRQDDLTRAQLLHRANRSAASRQQSTPSSVGWAECRGCLHACPAAGVATHFAWSSQVPAAFAAARIRGPSDRDANHAGSSLRHSGNASRLRTLSSSDFYIVADAATKPPLPLRSATGSERQSTSAPRLPLTWPPVRGSSSAADLTQNVCTEPTVSTRACKHRGAVGQSQPFAEGSISRKHGRRRAEACSSAGGRHSPRSAAAASPRKTVASSPRARALPQLVLCTSELAVTRSARVHMQRRVRRPAVR